MNHSKTVHSPSVLPDDVSFHMAYKNASEIPCKNMVLHLQDEVYAS